MPELDMPNLERLRLNVNPFTRVANLSYPSLKQLDLNCCSALTEVANITSPSLTNLWMIKNVNLASVSSFNLPNLEELRLNDSAFSTFPDNFYNFPKLKILNLMCPNLTTIPPFKSPALE